MRRPTTGWSAGALSCAVGASTAVQLAPEVRDRFYAQNGRLNFEIPGVTFTVRDWVQQPDGRIVIVGHTTTGHSFSENREIIVARFSTNGTPDASFDSDGYVVFDFGGSAYGGTVNLAR